MSLQPGQVVWPSCTAASRTAVDIAAMPLMGSALFVGYPFVGNMDRAGP